MSSHLIRFTDSELWNAFRQGDDEAFAFMYQKYGPVLYSYGYHLCRDRELVEDSIQDLFIHLQQHRTRLGETDSIRFYLYRSLRRRIAEKAQANSRWTSAEEMPHALDFEVSYPAEVDLVDQQTADEQKRKIEFLLNRLPRRQKEALYLMYYERLSYPEVAQVMGLEIKSVYNLIYNALVGLRQHISELNITFFTIAVGYFLSLPYW
jgi:RNA polymerase sigma factor (sigma-70 family)